MNTLALLRDHPITETAGDKLNAYSCNFEAMWTAMEQDLRPCRELSLARTKLEEAFMWLATAICDQGRAP